MTGHIWTSEPPALRPRVRRFLRAAAHLGGLVVVTPLAAGADRLVAEEARLAGARLEAVLPFAAAEYEADFPDTADAFQELLADCATVTVLEGATAPGPARNASYAAAGRAVVARSDVVLALWDGAPPRGEGGTGQIVAEAIAAGCPVVWIAPDGTSRLLPPDHPDREVAELVRVTAAD